MYRFLPALMLMACATGVWSATNDVTVDVEAMIGEATLVKKHADGKEESLVVPTGKTTQKDPGTGQTLLTPATKPNKVNEVVQAIAASAPDSEKQLPSEDGCSLGNAPHRLSAQPEYDETVAAALAKELESLSSGELMMVIAVLINNAKHLCIDSSTVANTIGLIAATRPEEAANAVFVAVLLDPDNAVPYTEKAIISAPKESADIKQASADAEKVTKDPNAVIAPRSPQPKPTPSPTKAKPPTKPSDVPPGGAIGKPPSPE